MVALFQKFAIAASVSYLVGFFVSGIASIFNHGLVFDKEMSHIFVDDFFVFAVLLVCYLNLSFSSRNSKQYDKERKQLRARHSRTNFFQDSLKSAFDCLNSSQNFVHFSLSEVVHGDDEDSGGREEYDYDGLEYDSETLEGYTDATNISLHSSSTQLCHCPAIQEPHVHLNPDPAEAAHHQYYQHHNQQVVVSFIQTVHIDPPAPTSLSEEQRAALVADMVAAFAYAMDLADGFDLQNNPGLSVVHQAHWAQAA